MLCPVPGLTARELGADWPPFCFFPLEFFRLCLSIEPILVPQVTAMCIHLLKGIMPDSRRKNKAYSDLQITWCSFCSATSEAPFLYPSDSITVWCLPDCTRPSLRGWRLLRAIHFPVLQSPAQGMRPQRIPHLLRGSGGLTVLKCQVLTRS